MVKAAIHAGHTPNVIAVPWRLCSGSDKSLLQGVFCPLHSRGSTSTRILSTTQQHVCTVQPGLDYFNKIFDSTLKDILLAFKAAT